jgi:hypothetical protein
VWPSAASKISESGKTSSIIEEAASEMSINHRETQREDAAAPTANISLRLKVKTRGSLE